MTIIIPCSHGWEQEHCTKDDEGAHRSDLDGMPILRATDDCYCGEARYIWLPGDAVAWLKQRLPWA